MSKRIDLKGRIFGKLTVIKFLKAKNSHAVWECICSCGNKIEVQAGNLLSGNSRGCNKCKGGNRKHGYHSHRLYGRWQSLKEKGILCEEWQDVATFLADVEDTFQEGYSLRRKDPSLPHSKINSHWTKPRKSNSIKSERVYFSN